MYVVPPSVTKSQRKRYRQSGAYTDIDDAYLLADLLRTDKHRLQPWQSDLPLTQEMRAKVSLHLHLTRMKVRLTNRLRAVLLRYYPGALEVFSKLGYAITLEFIRAFPTPQATAALSFEPLRASITTLSPGNCLQCSLAVAPRATLSAVWLIAG